MITNDAKQRILAAVDSAFDDQLTATAELVSSPSRREHEEPAQDLIETHLKHLGLDIDRWVIDSPELEAHPGFGPSTVDYTGMTDIVGTYTPARDSGKSLILNGHIDVVPQGPEDKWSRSPWDAEVRDGWMYGRGAGDMKAGLIANLFAFDAVRRAGFDLTGRVHLQSVVEEECTGKTGPWPPGCAATPQTRSSSRNRRKMPWSEPTSASCGSRSGSAAIPTHPREMANGFNAIDAAFEVMQALRVLEQTWNDRKSEHPYFEDLDHPINFNFGEIRGGDWPSSVPAWCELQVRVATYPGTKPTTPGPRSRSA